MFFEPPLVISYYTKNTPYEEEVKGLLSSCEQFAIACHVEGVEDLGSWEENCAFKPYFIRGLLHKFQRPLLWVDADAVFLRPMCFEEFMFSDLALLKYEEDNPCLAVAAGTVYVNATPGGFLGADLWCHYTDEIRKETPTPPFADEAALYFTYLSSPPLSFSPLPQRYCKIFDHPDEVKEVVIEHRQASRRYKTKKEVLTGRGGESL